MQDLKLTDRSVNRLNCYGRNLWFISRRVWRQYLTRMESDVQLQRHPLMSSQLTIERSNLSIRNCGHTAAAVRSIELQYISFCEWLLVSKLLYVPPYRDRITKRCYLSARLSVFFEPISPKTHRNFKFRENVPLASFTGVLIFGRKGKRSRSHSYRPPEFSNENKEVCRDVDKQFQ